MELYKIMFTFFILLVIAKIISAKSVLLLLIKSEIIHFSQESISNSEIEKTSIRTHYCEKKAFFLTTFYLLSKLKTTPLYQAIPLISQHAKHYSTKPYTENNDVFLE